MMWQYISIISSRAISSYSVSDNNAGNNFSIFTGHNLLSNLSFGWTFYKLDNLLHNLLTDNTLRKIT